ncbi:fasciclin-like arabinogalactan protein 11 [Senna tora]|uniref:Fasciclin-like arabinogalactan protein 11 n=1 Tax=Senna tora TaxID=362788 RepID=A0A834TLK3_9FABA|nr:fasciclin-like arabinogalactan protein 11 [Senna tora]
MKNQSLFFTLLILLSSFCSITTTSAQSPPASSPKLPPKPSPSPNLKPPAPAPAKPLVPTLPQSPESSSDSTPNDITKILKKAKVFSVFVRLLKTTEIINNINSQLITAKAGGLTILAPDDSAFSELKAGFMNTLNGGQKIELLQFHILPTYVASNNFDSLNNPVQTLAGVENPARLQLNVTTYGDSVNITTGVVNATVKGVVYSDKQLAIYRMDKVLLPMDLVLPADAPAKAKAPASGKTPKSDEKEKPSSSAAEDEEEDGTAGEKSGASGLLGKQGMMAFMSIGSAMISLTRDKSVALAALKEFTTTSQLVSTSSFETWHYCAICNPHLMPSASATATSSGARIVLIPDIAIDKPHEILESEVNETVYNLVM